MPLERTGAVAGAEACDFDFDGPAWSSVSPPIANSAAIDRTDRFERRAAGSE